jgi:hypothetical protein
LRQRAKDGGRPTSKRVGCGAGHRAFDAVRSGSPRPRAMAAVGFLFDRHDRARPASDARISGESERQGSTGGPRRLATATSLSRFRSGSFAACIGASLIRTHRSTSLRASCVLRSRRAVTLAAT